VRRRRILERAEDLPAPAHVRLAVWRATQEAGVAPDHGAVLASVRAQFDAERDTAIARLRAERETLRTQLARVVDERYARAVTALSAATGEDGCDELSA
jgi:hypothetical protein